MPGGECRALTRGDFRLEGEQPGVRCRASISKNAKDSFQYLKLETAAELRLLFANKLPAATAFNVPRERTVMDMLRADLADARAPWIRAAENDPAEHQRRMEGNFLKTVDGRGQRLDFHSLRHSAGAWLA